MELKTSDYLKSIEVGSGDMLDSIVSTMKRYYPDQNRKLSKLFAFFENGDATSEDITELASELNIVTSCLKKISPENAVYGPESKERQAPWKNGIADNITSCADLFLTSDGKNLLQELGKIFDYSRKNNTSISFM